MKKDIFANLINRLIEVEPTSSPLLSCFVNLEHPRSDYFTELESQASLVAKRMSGTRVIDFEDALEEVRDYLENKISPTTKGVAIYSRWGDYPVFLPMQFEVPLKTEFIVDDLPHIYPLIELKDTYHRFVIAILTEGEARILETTIGSITEDILEQRPELRERIKREWTREHYRSYCEEQANRFAKEKVAIIENLMNRGGHNHLVLAGSPKMVARLKKALPTRLRAKVIDTLIANPREGLSPILTESINMFIAMENVESHSRVFELESAVFSNGLGVCGYEQSLEALTIGNASMLIMDQNLLEHEMREELVRHASKLGIPIETVNRNETMIRLGGVGCLLRYLPVETQAQRIMLAA
jgi:ribosomal protein L30E